jgi:hypothetical protein
LFDAVLRVRAAARLARIVVGSMLVSATQLATRLELGNTRGGDLAKVYPPGLSRWRRPRAVGRLQPQLQPVER